MPGGRDRERVAGVRGAFECVPRGGQPPTGADIDAITDACQEQEIKSWLFIPPPFTRADAERFVSEVIPGELAAGTAAVLASACKTADRCSAW